MAVQLLDGVLTIIAAPTGSYVSVTNHLVQRKGDSKSVGLISDFGFLVNDNGVSTYFSSAYRGPQRIVFQGSEAGDIFHNDSTLPATASGGGGNDILIGGSDVDTFFGLDGHDQLFGRGGNDVLDGGAGEDLLHGGAGNDKLYGHFGNDVLGRYTTNAARNAAGIPYLSLLDGTIAFSTEMDEPGDDELFGYYGNDVLQGGTGNDQLRGEFDDDWVYGDDNNDTLYGGAGTDRLFGDAGKDSIFGGDGYDQLTGGSEPDRFLDLLDGDVLTDVDYTTDARIRFARGAADVFDAVARPAQNWTDREIERIDEVLGLLHHSASGTQLLKTASGGVMTFARHGGSGRGDNANGTINLTNAQVPADQNGSQAATDWLRGYVLHEVGHNWNGPQIGADRWTDFGNISNWRNLDPLSPQFAHAGETNINQWYRINTEFVSTYARNMLTDDWAESFSAYFTDKAGWTFYLTNGGATAGFAAAPTKMALIRNWVSTL